MMSVENLRKTYHLRPVLRDVTFQVGEAASVGIFGKNGAGKTTLLKVIARICSCDGGDVRFDGRSIMKGPASNRQGILYLGHQPNLYPILTAEENLRFVCRLYGLAISEEELLATLEEVGLVRQRWDPIRYYSRGMLQRLGIAKAMAVPWRLLLMDEPVTGLDEKGIELLERFILRCQEQQKSLIVVSHQLSWLERFCSSILNLVDGEVHEISPR
ncbi:MAG: ABC transporter ATP-binding protein [Candidatus Neomarinimicrobiota bacterium]